MSEHDQTMAVAVSRAMNKSAELLRTAADAGDTEARFALGLLYLLGRGVETNLGEAMNLFSQAADAGDEQAAAFREVAVHQLAQEQQKQQLLNDAAVEVMKDAKRKQRFPKPRLVDPD